MHFRACLFNYLITFTLIKSIFLSPSATYITLSVFFQTFSAAEKMVVKSQSLI